MADIIGVHIRLALVEYMYAVNKGHMAGSVLLKPFSLTLSLPETAAIPKCHAISQKLDQLKNMDNDSLNEI